VLLWPPERLVRYLRVIFAGVPIWFVGGIIFVFAPELGRSMGLAAPAPGKPVVNPAVVIMCGYAGAAVGDILSGLISQLLKSRVRTILLFQIALLGSGAMFFWLGGQSHTVFYTLVFTLGVATGYWAVFVTVASESFGTNLRATATTTAPNFVRGFAVVIVTVWELLRASWGATGGAILVGIAVVFLGMFATAGLRDPFGRSLDFDEE
jgi:MFS transporter, putative metabolite:H+ symporter